MPDDQDRPAPLQDRPTDGAHGADASKGTAVAKKRVRKRRAPFVL